MNNKFQELTELNKSAYSTELSPFFPNCTNAIVFETSGMYVQYLDVALRSLISNVSDNNFYDIIILTNEIDIFDCNLLLLQLENHKNISLRFYDPSEIVESYIKRARYKYLNLNYFRLALPWILDKYDKVVNLGVDIVIKQDIAKLLDLQMTDAEYIAGAMDLGYIGRLSMDIPQDELDLKNPEGYVNADVLVFNNKNIRRDFSMNTVLELWQKYKFRCAEQDALNVLYENHIHYLDLRWNVMPRRMNSTIHIAHNSDENIKLWIECLNDPFIVHFAAFPKAWDWPTVEFAEQWWHYARKSPYYEELIRRMVLSSSRGMFEGQKPKFVQKIKKILLSIFPSNSLFIRICKKIYSRFFVHDESRIKFGKMV